MKHEREDNEDINHSSRSGEPGEIDQVTITGQVVLFIGNFYSNTDSLPFSKFILEVRGEKGTRRVRVFAFGKEMSDLARAKVYRGQTISVTGERILQKQTRKDGTTSRRRVFQATEINILS